jgi:hypothetical protein
MCIHEWRNYVKIRDHLLSSGCILFGGAVRDEIIHNMNATNFYRELSDYYKKTSDLKTRKLFEYSNKDISPHTIGRLIIPNDIDAFIRRDQLNDLITYFTRNYKTQVVKTRDLSYFKDDLPANKFILQKIELMTKFNNKYFTVKIDLITYESSGEYPTMNELPLDFDFDVNSLFWSKEKGIYSRLFTSSMSHIVSIHNTVILNEIYTNISNKVALMDDAFLWNNVRQTNDKILFIKENRIEKLIRKGWTIKINFNIYDFHKSDTMSQDDNCVICLKNRNDFKACVNFKVCNCKTYICLECIKKEHTKINKCPSCRKTIMGSVDSHIYARNEIYMYEKCNKL